jgi:hypothetical protein
MSLLLLFPSGGGGGTLWTPSDLTVPPDHWWDAQDSATVHLDGSNLLQTWDDKGSAGANATQSTAANRDAFIASSNINSYPAVRCDGANNKGYVFTAATTSLTEFCFNSSIDNLDCKLGATDHFSGAVYSALSSPSIVGATWSAGTGTAVLTFWEDGVQVAQLTGLTTTTAGAFFGVQDAAGTGGSGFGRWICTAGGGRLFNRQFDMARHFNGDIGEMILCNYELTTSEREYIEGYLAHRWDTDGSLDAGHPFKSAAPTTGGGTVYDDTISEGIGVAEALTVNTKYAVAVSDGIGTARTLTVNTKYAVAVSEGVATASALAGQAKLLATLTDGVANAETLANFMRTSMSLADGVGTAESLTNAARSYVTLTDGIANAETLTPIAVYGLSLTDGTNFADTLLGGQVYDDALTDNIGASDALASSKATLATISEGIGTAPVLSTTSRMTVSLAEGLAVSRQLIANQASPVALADSVGVAETLSLLRRSNVEVTDTVGVTCTEALNWQLNASLSDGLTIAELTATQGIYGATLADSLTIDVFADGISSVTELPALLRRAVIGSEIRSITVSIYESRRAVVEAQNRTVIVDAQTRRIAVESQDRRIVAGGLDRLALV